MVELKKYVPEPVLNRITETGNQTPLDEVKKSYLRQIEGRNFGKAFLRLYAKELGSFKRTLSWPPALLSYLLIVLGIVFFVFPRVKNLHGFLVFFWGSFFGLIAYGVYDLVNLATLADWTLRMTVVDMLWGAIVCGLVTYLSSLFL